MLNALFNSLDLKQITEPLLRVQMRQRVAGIIAHLQEHNLGDEAIAAEMKTKSLRGFGDLVEANDDKGASVPAKFFELVFGPRMLHAGLCLTKKGLAEAEEATLRAICADADVEAGQNVLVLADDFGAVSGWIVEQFVGVNVYCMTTTQDARDTLRAKLPDVSVEVADLHTFSPDQFAWPKGQFDRILAIETLAELPSYSQIFERMASWLSEDGKVLIQAVTNRDFSHRLASDKDEDWMSQHFFGDKLVISPNLFGHFNEHLKVDRVVESDGKDYATTATAWLSNLADNKAEAVQAFDDENGAGAGQKWVPRWRAFFQTLQERYGHEDGKQWFSARYVLSKA